MATLFFIVDLPLRDIYHCGVEPLHLSCDGGELIQIVQAHFGRLAYDGEMTCGQGNAREYFEDQVHYSVQPMPKPKLGRVGVKDQTLH